MITAVSDSKRYDAYRLKWAEAGAGTIQSTVPIHMDIELASACNYKCPMCPQSEIKVSFAKDFMDTMLALNLLTEAARIGVSSIKLNWRGEAVLHPEFARIAMYAKKLDFADLMLNTNGSHTKPEVRAAVHNMDTLIFSIDTLKPDVAEVIRPGGPLEDVLFNLDCAVIARNIHGSPKRIRVNFTRQKENWDEVEAIQAYCDKLGVECYIKPVFPRNPPKVGQYYDESKFTVKGRKNCQFPFQRLTVAFDGRVAPCCVPWEDTLYIGNLNHQTIQQVWRSMNLFDIQKDAKSADYKHPTCVGCTSWASYDVVQK